MPDNVEISPAQAGKAIPADVPAARAATAAAAESPAVPYIAHSSRSRVNQNAREKDPDESSSERWLVSYADFITLVMVMFMMLYALQLVKAKGAAMSELRTQDKTQAVSNAPVAAKEPDLDARGADLIARLQVLREGGQIKLLKTAKGLEIEINARLLFPSGDAHVLPQAVPVLNNIATALRDFSESNILVEGHTDSMPISNGRYESNWELSSARAGAVVRHFVDHGIQASRLIAMGRADNVPAVLGSTPDALAANRRVTILVQHY